MSTFILLTIYPTCDEWTFPSLSFGWVHFHFRGSRSDFLFCILLHIHRQWNRTVYHGGNTDVLGLHRYRPDAVPVETRLLPASSRFITVFDSLPGYSRWVPVVLNTLKQPRTWAGSTRFNTVYPGSPRLSTVPPRLWHGSSRFIPDNQTGMNRHLKPGQWERGLTSLHSSKDTWYKRYLCRISHLCMPLASFNKTGRKKIETLKGPRRWILLLDYSNHGGWGMLAFLKGFNFGLRNCQFISNRSMMNMQSWKKQRTQIWWIRNQNKRARVNLQLNLCPSKSTTPVFKRILFQGPLTVVMGITVYRCL